MRTTVDMGSVYEESCIAGGRILLIYRRVGEGVTVAAVTGPVVRAGRNRQQPVTGKLDIKEYSRIWYTFP